MKLIELADSWIMPVRDGTVTRVSLDYAQITIFCEPLALTIEGEIIITNQSGGKAVVDPDPGSEPHLLSPILAVLRDTIQEVIATKDGMLIVRFGSGTRIEVPADTKYEAWHVNELSAADGFRVVSMPGGQLAIWQGVELSSRASKVPNCQLRYADARQGRRHPTSAASRLSTSSP